VELFDLAQVSVLRLSRPDTDTLIREILQPLKSARGPDESL
jgi:hypothetical protein